MYVFPNTIKALKAKTRENSHIIAETEACYQNSIHTACMVHSV